MQETPKALYRLIGCVGLTTGLCGALLVATPDGFASVPYVTFVFFVYVAVFISVAWLERTVWINCATVAVFWIIAAIAHAQNVGDAPAADQRMIEGLILILVLAVAHLGVQLLLHYCIHLGLRTSGAQKVIDR